jgi:hypothetical protein
MQELKRSDKLFIPNCPGGKYWSLLMMFQLKPSFELFEVELEKLLGREANVHYTVSNVNYPSSDLKSHTMEIRT